MALKLELTSYDKDVGWGCLRTECRSENFKWVATGEIHIGEKHTLFSPSIIMVVK